GGAPCAGAEAGSRGGADGPRRPRRGRERGASGDRGRDRAGGGRIGGDMYARALTPILNVSNLEESFAWFERLGWTRLWSWGALPSFGAVGSGEREIFLCLDGQGGRGRSEVTTTFGPDGSDDA